MRLAIAGPRKWSLIQKKHLAASKIAEEWLSAYLDLAKSREEKCEAISSLQLGLDTTFASLCVHKEIPLTVILSCKEQDKYWDTSKKKTYAYLLSNAQTVENGLDTYEPHCIHDQAQKIDLWLTKAPATLFLVRYQSLTTSQQNRKEYAEQYRVTINTHRIKP